MGTLKAFVARHPVARYFTLTFAISWTGVLLTIGGLAGMTGVTAQDNPLFPLTVLSMLLGPSLTAIALTGFTWWTASYPCRTSCSSRDTRSLGASRRSTPP